jgi:hypothetical protein
MFYHRALLIGVTKDKKQQPGEQAALRLSQLAPRSTGCLPMLSRVALRPFCPRAGAVRPRTQQHRQPGIAAQQLHRGDWHRPAGRRPLRRPVVEQALGDRTEVTGTAMATDASVPTASGGNIFVYGTLMAEEIVRLLIQRMPEHSPATLAGHRCGRCRLHPRFSLFPYVFGSRRRSELVRASRLLSRAAFNSLSSFIRVSTPVTVAQPPLS